MRLTDESRGIRRAAQIRVPATTSNLGSGFDAVGLALQLYLVVEVSEIESGPSRLELSGLDTHLIPTDESNLVWQTMRAVAQLKGRNLPAFLLRIENQIPIAKGLGSSAAAILAGGRCSKRPLRARPGAGESAGDRSPKGGAPRQRGSRTDGRAGGFYGRRKNPFFQVPVSPGMDRRGRNPRLRVADQKSPRGAS